MPCAVFRNPPLTLAEWYDERDWILDDYLPQRSDIVMQQFRDADLYPSVDAPSFNRHGGLVDKGFYLMLSAPSGTVTHARPRSRSTTNVSITSPISLTLPSDSL